MLLQMKDAGGNSNKPTKEISKSLGLTKSTVWNALANSATPKCLSVSIVIQLDILFSVQNSMLLQTTMN